LFSECKINLMEQHVAQFDDCDPIDLDRVGYMHICTDTCTDPCMYAFVCTSNYVRMCICVFYFLIVSMYASMSVCMNVCMM